jgi:hypothetical protein
MQGLRPVWREAQCYPWQALYLPLSNLQGQTLSLLQGSCYSNCDCDTTKEGTSQLRLQLMQAIEVQRRQSARHALNVLREEASQDWLSNNLPDLLTGPAAGSPLTDIEGVYDLHWNNGQEIVGCCPRIMLSAKDGVLWGAAYCDGVLLSMFRMQMPQKASTSAYPAHYSLPLDAKGAD